MMFGFGANYFFRRWDRFDRGFCFADWLDEPESPGCDWSMRLIFKRFGLWTNHVLGTALWYEVCMAKLGMAPTSFPKKKPQRVGLSNSWIL
jgi:hypothetical protein